MFADVLLKNFEKFSGKQLCQSFFYKFTDLQLATLSKKRLLSCEFFEIFRNTFFTEHLRVTASAFLKLKSNKQLHRLQFSINRYHPGYLFVYRTIILWKEYFSTKISIMEKLLTVCDNLSEKINFFNRYLLLWMTDADCSLKENYQFKLYIFHDDIHQY